MRTHALAIAIAATVLVPTAVAAPKPPSSVTIAATPTAVTFGKAVMLGGKLTGGKGVAGVTVTVQADAFPLDGQFDDVATAVTDANGDWHATNVPVALTRYRAVAKSSPPATSSAVDVGVRLRVGVRVSDRTPSRGERVRFSGQVAPAHDGAVVQIQRRRASGRWRTVARTSLRDAGTEVSTYSKRIRVRRSGTYRVRVSSADADHLPGTSSKRRLTLGG